MPSKIAAAHHSVTDWDFELGTSYRVLASDYYISAPTSLKYGVPLGSFGGSILCRIPATQCLPQGEVRTWIRTTHNFTIPGLFRNQKPLGGAEYDNSYYLIHYDPIVYLHRRVNNIPTIRDQTTGYFKSNEWIHYRTFWYNGKTPGDVPALCVDLYREVAGEWVKLGNTMYDTANSWKDSEINRCGFHVSLIYPQQAWFDNTEIWGPV
ncbi:hypothetical protein ES708_18301 [subsurface metagenome]